MSILTRKVQVLLTDEQYHALLALAGRRGNPVSVLLREAVVEQLLRQTRQAAKQKACDEIAAMALAVADWSETEEEIERVHAGGRKRP